MKGGCKNRSDDTHLVSLNRSDYFVWIQTHNVNPILCKFNTTAALFLLGPTNSFHAVVTPSRRWVV